MSKLTYAYAFTCLTLYKQDISELIHLFQTHLEQVEITIDGLPIADTAQLDQFDSAYQATSLLARGYRYGAPGLDGELESETRSLELRMSKERAVLQLRGWKASGKAEPEVSRQIKKVLWRCQNRIHQFLQLTVNSFLAGISGPALASLLEQHHVNFLLQLALIVGPGLLLLLIVLFFYASLVKVLRLETHMFLFPGAIKAARVYGRREVAGRVILAFVIFIAFDVLLIIAFRLLWK